MKRYVVDASVAIKWFISDAADKTGGDRALALLGRASAGECHFLQPPHWISEIAAVLARREPDNAPANIADLLLFDFCSVIATAPVYRRAIELARRLDHHLFDTLYHATGLEQDAVFVTADRRYFNKAKALGNIVMLEATDLEQA